MIIKKLYEKVFHKKHPPENIPNIINEILEVDWNRIAKNLGEPENDGMR